MPAPLRPLRLLALACVAVLVACGGPRPKPQPLPRFTAPTRHKGEVSANDILFRAIALVGTPYRYGGNTPQGGFDCSGLVYYAYEQAGYRVPRTSQELFRAARKISVDDADPGDLMFFQDQTKLSHVGIYLGDGLFVHAPASGQNVAVGSLDSAYYQQHLVAVGRLLPH